MISGLSGRNDSLARPCSTYVFPNIASRQDEWASFRLSATQKYRYYNPTLRFGVCDTRDPAPIPICLGVPGTINLDENPLDVFTAKASWVAFLAVLE